MSCNFLEAIDRGDVFFLDECPHDGAIKGFPRTFDEFLDQILIDTLRVVADEERIEDARLGTGDLDFLSFDLHRSYQFFHRPIEVSIRCLFPGFDRPDGEGIVFGQSEVFRLFSRIDDEFAGDGVVTKIYLERLIAREEVFSSSFSRQYLFRD